MDLNEDLIKLLRQVIPSAEGSLASKVRGRQAGSQAPGQDLADAFLEEVRPTPEKLLAQKLRRQRDQQNLAEANTQAHSLDLANFAAGVSNNEALAKSMGTLAKATNERYKPIQMGQTGFALPETGDYTESPMYTEQKQADRTAKLAQALQAQEGANERAQMLVQSRELMAAMNNDTRMLLQALVGQQKAAASAGKGDKDLDKGVQQLSAALEKAGIPEVESGITVVRGILDKYKDKDMPGFGRWDSWKPTAMLDDEGQMTRTEMQGLANIILKSRSGAAVTEPEQRRFLTEIGAGKAMDEKTLRKGWESVFNALETKRQNILAGANDEVLTEYNNRFGSKYGRGGAPGNAGGTPKKRLEDYTDEELAAAIEAAKRKP